MNHFLISAGVSSAFAVLAGLFLIRGRYPSDRRFGCFWLVVAYWTALVAFQFQVMDVIGPFWWGWFLHAGCIFVPVSFLDFTVSLCGLKSLRWAWAVRGFRMAAAAFLVLILISDVFTGEVVFRSGYAYPKPSMLYPVYIFFFQAIGLLTLIALLSLRRNLPAAARRWLYVYLGVHLAAYAGSMDNYLIMYDRLIPPLFPYGLYAIAIYAVVGSYAYLKMVNSAGREDIKRGLTPTGPSQTQTGSAELKPANQNS